MVVNQIKLLAPVFNDFTEDEIVLLSVMEIRSTLYREYKGRKKKSC